MYESYLSVKWDPGTEGVDALFQTNWHSELNFVNPPFRLLPKVIEHIQKTRSEATVIAPCWPAKTWLQKLKQMASAPETSKTQADVHCLFEFSPRTFEESQMDSVCLESEWKKCLTGLR